MICTMNQNDRILTRWKYGWVGSSVILESSYIPKLADVALIPMVSVCSLGVLLNPDVPLNVQIVAVARNAVHQLQLVHHQLYILSWLFIKTELYMWAFCNLCYWSLRHFCGILYCMMCLSPCF